MKRDVALNKNFVGKIPQGQFFDFSSPYGYGGWLIEGTSVESVYKEYNEWCHENGIISEFVRFSDAIFKNAF